jgi:hypothetical protein
MGIALHHCPAVVRTHNVPKEVLPYYETAPSPTPCMLNLIESQKTLRPDVIKAVANHKLNIDLDCDVSL